MVWVFSWSINKNQPVFPRCVDIPLFFILGGVSQEEKWIQHHQNLGSGWNGNEKKCGSRVRVLYTILK
ncbi:hypothetical protein BVRB_7g180630 [Beta vulgaris subsp. vulgaris]|uniref:Uncharacterized protein n=1 Tax=Beta vulgaris subsp. vulgaris TaxID=3555 RepID=A0A0J8B6K0_BETVV|nr:hypothetical protein BVRB_7g180630 [Beta vulgaris subsp. vulgaris]